MPLQPAVLGTARLNNFRLNYLGAVLAAAREVYVTILIDGALACIRVGSVTIHDVINDSPNTMDLVLGPDPIPTNGATVRAYINSDDPRLLFSGTLQVLDLTYQGREKASVYPCQAQDDTPKANRRIPLASYTNVSATTIAQELVANFAPGFTSDHVQAGLPEVSILLDGSEGGMNGCLRALAKLVGGYFYWEDGDLHFFQEESASETPDPITEASRFLESPRIRHTSDDSQLRTRVYGKGHGEPVLIDIDPTVGSPPETLLPLQDVSLFEATGGQAISGADILDYTGLEPGGDGAIVGPGVAPTTAPAVEAVAGAGVNSGDHDYAYTWVTGAGETLPSPLASVTTGELDPPPHQPGLTGPTPGGSLGIGIYKYAYTFVNAAGETTPSPVRTASIPTSSGFQTWLVQMIEAGPTGTTARKLYRTAVDGTQLKLVATIADNVHNQNYSDGNADGSLGADAPTVNTATVNQVEISGVAVGPSGTTSRKVYRTAAGGSQLKLQQTIANNTATVGVTDSTADGSLGANAPTSDTSGLTQPQGQINPGATSMIVTSTAPFRSGGGWLDGPGSQVIRYGAISGNTLLDIPSSGQGSVSATIAYGATVRALPMLVGVSGLDLPLVKGATVHVWVQVDDPAAQAALAARDGSDGIIEHRIVDERREAESLRALCAADLLQYGYPLETVRYATRDVKTKSGKPISISLVKPPISDDLVIQDVTITEINTARGVAPRFTVTASSARFSVEDLLRRLTGTLEGANAS